MPWWWFNPSFCEWTLHLRAFECKSSKQKVLHYFGWNTLSHKGLKTLLLKDFLHGRKYNSINTNQDLISVSKDCWPSLLTLSLLYMQTPWAPAEASMVTVNAKGRVTSHVLADTRDHRFHHTLFSVQWESTILQLNCVVNNNAFFELRLTSSPVNRIQWDS